MLSVIIPTEGVEQPAVATLAALVPGAAAGIIREVLLVDRVGNGVIERVADVPAAVFSALKEHVPQHWPPARGRRARHG